MLVSDRNRWCDMDTFIYHEKLLEKEKRKRALDLFRRGMSINHVASTVCVSRDTLVDIQRESLKPVVVDSNNDKPSPDRVTCYDGKTKKSVVDIREMYLDGVRPAIIAKKMQVPIRAVLKSVRDLPAQAYRVYDEVLAREIPK